MKPMLSPEEQAVFLQTSLLEDGDMALIDRILSLPGVCAEEFKSGQVLYHPHHFRRCLGVLLSGQVYATNGTLAVSILKSGALFGASALYSPSLDYAATLTAHTRCKVLFLPQPVMDRLLETEPLIRHNYLCYLSGRIRFLSRRLLSAGQYSVEGKLARYLLVNGGSGSVQIPATELAKRLGIGRASLYRAFETMEHADLIQRSGKTIHIPNLAALESIP